MTNDELRKLAEAARWDWGNYYWYEGTVEKVDAVDAAYIIAASPDRILSLLDEVDHLLEMHVSLLAIRPTRGELRDENERLRAARLLAAGFADQFRRGLIEIRDVPGIDARAAARNTLASVKEDDA